MTQSMVEKVAEAIWIKQEPDGLGDPTFYLPHARAAIEAMREPTPEMHLAGVKTYTARDGRSRPAALRDAYEAWVNAALSEIGGDE